MNELTLKTGEHDADSLRISVVEADETGSILHFSKSCSDLDPDPQEGEFRVFLRPEQLSLIAQFLTAQTLHQCPRCGFLARLEPRENGRSTCVDCGLDAFFEGAMGVELPPDLWPLGQDES